MNYISTYLQHQRQLLEESFLLFEAHKHWPESYIKSAANKLMSRFQQTGLTQEQALKITSAAAQKFGAWFSHDSKRCPLFDKMILWMCEMPFQSLQLVNVNSLLDVMKPIVDGLQLLVASDISEHSISRIKLMSLDEFAKACVKARQTAQNDIPVSTGQHEVIPISSWEQMNSLYGGKTGFNGAGGWCHTEGKGTWNDWTQNGDKAFFVIQRKGWEDIKAPDPQTASSAFDDYGMSLIAILVDVETGYLLRETLRWNHKKAPPMGESYVDHAFEDSWEKLDKAVGLDVKSICDEHLAEARRKIEQIRADADKIVEQRMRNADVIDVEIIPDEYRPYITHVVVPDSVLSIGNEAFINCKSLTSIAIPGSVKSIGDSAFSNCTNLKSIAIPDSVTSIESGAFFNCTSLTSIAIPNSVKIIGVYAFSRCTSLTSITIPDSVTSIGKAAFYYCTNLKSIVFKGKTLEEVKSMNFYPWGADESIIKAQL